HLDFVNLKILLKGDSWIVFKYAARSKSLPIFQSLCFLLKKSNPLWINSLKSSIRLRDGSTLWQEGWMKNLFIWGTRFTWIITSGIFLYIHQNNEKMIHCQSHMNLDLNGNELNIHNHSIFKRMEKLIRIKQSEILKALQVIETQKFTEDIWEREGIALKMFKISRPIRYGETLELGPYMSQGKEEGKRIIYDLIGVIVHSGNDTRCGHYYSFCKSSNGTWLHFNDEQVSTVSLQTVLKQQAYLLVYASRLRSLSRSEMGVVLDRDKGKNDKKRGEEESLSSKFFSQWEGLKAKEDWHSTFKKSKYTHRPFTCPVTPYPHS
ncbi:hypothetical protein PCK1_001484, partial [Pneumocystis canis]